MEGQTRTTETVKYTPVPLILIIPGVPYHRTESFSRESSKQNYPRTYGEELLPRVGCVGM